MSWFDVSNYVSNLVEQAERSLDGVLRDEAAAPRPARPHPPQSAPAPADINLWEDEEDGTNKNATRRAAQNERSASASASTSSVREEARPAESPQRSPEKAQSEPQTVKNFDASIFDDEGWGTEATRAETNGDVVRAGIDNDAWVNIDTRRVENYSTADSMKETEGTAKDTESAQSIEITWNDLEVVEKSTEVDAASASHEEEQDEVDMHTKLSQDADSGAANVDERWGGSKSFEQDGIEEPPESVQEDLKISPAQAESSDGPEQQMNPDSERPEVLAQASDGVTSTDVNEEIVLDDPALLKEQLMLLRKELATSHALAKKREEQLHQNALALATQYQELESLRTASESDDSEKMTALHDEFAVRISQLDQRLHHVASERDAVKKELAASNRQKEEVIAKLNQEKVLCAELRKEGESLANQLAKARSQLKESEGKGKDLEKQIEELKSKLVKATANVGERLELEQKSRSDFEQRENELRTTIAELRAALMDRSDASSAYESSRDEALYLAQQELQQTAQQVEELREQLRDATRPFQQKIFELEQAASVAGLKYEKLDEKYRLAVRDYSRAESDLKLQVEELISSIEKIKAERNMQKEQIARVNGENGRLKDDLAKLKDELTENQKKFESLEEKSRQSLEKVKSEVKALKNEKMKLQSSMADLQAELAQARQSPRERRASSYRSDEESSSSVSHSPVLSSPVQPRNGLLSMSAPGNATDVDMLHRELELAQQEKKKIESQLVQICNEMENLKTASSKAVEIQQELESLKVRHSASLELLGERTERVHELENDIIDLKQLYKQQVTELCAQIENLRKR